MYYQEKTDGQAQTLSLAFISVGAAHSYYNYCIIISVVFLFL